MFNMKKRGQMWETLIPWIIAIVLLVFVIILYAVLSDKGSGAIEFFKNLMRFR